MPHELPGQFNRKKIEEMLHNTFEEPTKKSEECGCRNDIGLCQLTSPLNQPCQCICHKEDLEKGAILKELAKVAMQET